MRIIDGMPDRIHIEVTYKGKSSLPCVYMEAAVQDILPLHHHKVAYSRVDIQSPKGRQRFLALSCSLFGEKGVYQHHRLAPLPGLFMDGELVFDARAVVRFVPVVRRVEVIGLAVDNGTPLAGDRVRRRQECKRQRKCRAGEIEAAHAGNGCKACAIR